MDCSKETTARPAAHRWLHPTKAVNQSYPENAARASRKEAYFASRRREVAAGANVDSCPVTLRHRADYYPLDNRFLPVSSHNSQVFLSEHAANKAVVTHISHPPSPSL